MYNCVRLGHSRVADRRSPSSFVQRAAVSAPGREHTYSLREEDKQGVKLEQCDFAM